MNINENAKQLRQIKQIVSLCEMNDIIDVPLSAVLQGSV